MIDKPRINNDSMIVINFIGTKINKFQCNGVAKFFIPIVKNGFSVGKETALLFF
ncbi:hypothetical protein PHEL49_2118 [Polaribacter sp. Hel1_33_49]|nr:hypothetical protein PHEL49_2118 [Polaribacter sp. Hel1_33_49]